MEFRGQVVGAIVPDLVVDRISPSQYGTMGWTDITIAFEIAHYDWEEYDDWDWEDEEDWDEWDWGYNDYFGYNTSSTNWSRNESGGVDNGGHYLLDIAIYQYTAWYYMLVEFDISSYLDFFCFSFCFFNFTFKFT